MGAFKDISGQKFGKLTALKRVDGPYGKAMWLCKCDCGVEKVAASQNLREGRTSSCGCSQKEGARRRLLTHGRSYKGIEGAYEYARETHLLRKYGITFEQYNKLLSDQGNKCKICETPFGQFQGDTYVDHCHKSGVVRGLLCRKCNAGIGQFSDRADLLASAIAYLEDVSSFVSPQFPKVR